ncbi:carboxylesterase family protein [Novosphingobium profundi]|uniref:carboxylesterase/lipase family protein n=1 Tax=Novosphingobium profundi TaxID=1774954 RepID=UPI001BDA23F8|nr:carboxylesterase family protein [Novosphingobium profundi]MBT0667967.1 carboxylesterase family protein [Novosphingobium profundi]
MLRRSSIAAMAVMASLALSNAACAQGTGAQVTVADGRLEGTQADGVLAWKGIPFAAAPIGDLRWRAPQPATPWSGVRDASQYGHDCMQVPFPSDAAPLGTPPAEDCLYLNVWKPAGAKGPLPVLVWIYGGGFVNGGASPPTYSGANLAKQGIMVVSFNYRVGRFGTFAHPALTKADEDEGLLGNYGYLDQIAALKWVKANIAAFGGDPAQVTIAGESAGGMSVNTLLTSPLSQGLFARAVVMSGGNGSGMGPATLTTSEQVGIAFAKSKGIAPDDPAALAKLRALSAEQVTDGLNMMALFTPGERTFSGPFPDGRIAVDALSAFKAGDFAKVPLMIGATSADMGGKTGFMVAGARQVAGVVAGQGVPVYEYRFSYVADSVGKPGAQHATDIPFFFDTTAIKYGEETSKRDLAMGKAMSGYLVNFTRTGDPNGKGLPTWPRYAKASDTLVDFTETGKVLALKDPWGAEIDAAAAKQASR